jgi:hypothetical protein
LVAVAMAVAFRHVNEPILQLAWITGANGLIGDYPVQTAPRFAARLDAFAGHH